MPTFHDNYGGSAYPAPFDGKHAELQGGEYLGADTQPNLMGPGDIVTATDPIEEFATSAYWYDPELKIDGNSYVKHYEYDENDKARWSWTRIARKTGRS